MNPNAGRIFALCLVALAASVTCADRAEDPIQELVPALVLAQPQSVLVIGDSLTEYSRAFGLQESLGPGYLVSYRAVINTDFAYWTPRVDAAFQTATAGPPVHILVALGTNDGFVVGPADYLGRVRDFHAALRSRSLGRAYYFTWPDTLVPNLGPALRVNNAALSASYPRDNTVLVDLATTFAQAAPVPALYESGDPLHPTAAGYQLMNAAMRAALLR